MQLLTASPALRTFQQSREPDEEEKKSTSRGTQITERERAVRTEESKLLATVEAGWIKFGLQLR